MIHEMKKINLIMMGKGHGDGYSSPHALTV